MENECIRQTIIMYNSSRELRLNLVLRSPCLVHAVGFTFDTLQKCIESSSFAVPSGIKMKPKRITSLSDLRATNDNDDDTTVLVVTWDQIQDIHDDKERLMWRLRCMQAQTLKLRVILMCNSFWEVPAALHTSAHYGMVFNAHGGGDYILLDFVQSAFWLDVMEPASDRQASTPPGHPTIEHHGTSASICGGVERVAS